MSPEIITNIITALWLGILTSISPCTLAPNIAAISFLGRRVDSASRIILSSVLYTLGRMLTYSVIGAITIKSVLSIPSVANFLQNYMNLIIGPMLFVIGIILLDIIKISFGETTQNNFISNFIANSQKYVQDNIDKIGLFGAFAFGMIFALAFCPISAGLFFGSLIPMAIANNSYILMPFSFAIGTALPVIAFAVIMTISVQLVGKIFDNIIKVETWIRKSTAILFILIGLYLILRNNFGINL